MLRRAGLYFSHVVEWRGAREAGALLGLAGKPRPAASGRELIELARLRRRAVLAEAELVKHKLALEIQGKASEFLKRLLTLAESADDPRRQP